jgi:CRISPR type III-A-associated protein Csm2
LLAYARGRDNIPHDFYQIMKFVLDFNKIQRVRDYRTLVHFLEAIVAYHKFRESRRG